jgi:histidinol-phosphate aminotransferase
MNIDVLARPAIRALTPYQPGKPVSELARERGLPDIIKLASNENPLGPGPQALAAARAALSDSHFYPDGSGFELKAALARHLAVTPAQITLGNGSNDVLELIARVFLEPGVEAVFSEHAFAVYPLATQAAGATARVAPAHAGQHGPRYGHDLTALREQVTPLTRVVFIANPNNPTGTTLPAAGLRSFLASLPDTTVVVIDEAYFEYVEASDYPNTVQWLADFPRLIVTRTFSKAYGLAGLRIGYAVSSAEMADWLNRVRLPFNVSMAAMAAAQAALDDTDYLRRSVALNREGLAYLTQGFGARGLDYIPSMGNFVAVDVGRLAAPVYTALLQEGVIVRPVANYGLPRHLRVTVGLPEQNRLFLEALDRVLAA